jgi:hypothetical protein
VFSWTVTVTITTDHPVSHGQCTLRDAYDSDAEYEIKAINQRDAAQTVIETVPTIDLTQLIAVENTHMRGNPMWFRVNREGLVYRDTDD